MSDESVREILEDLEPLEEDFPEEEEKLRTLLIQEEDLAFGIQAFDSAMDKVESHLDRGAELENLIREEDIGQLRDDRSALHERYAAGENYNAQLWDAGQMLDDILQNEDYMGTPDGPINELVHLTPNDTGGLLLEKVQTLEDAEISYPDGGSGHIDIDYGEIRSNAREGAREAVKEEMENLDTGDTENGYRDDSTYGVGFFNLLEGASTDEINRRGFLRDTGITIAGLAGLAGGAALLRDQDGADENGGEPGIGALPQGYSTDMPSNCEIGWEEVTNDVADEGYVGTEYFPDGQIDKEEIAFKDDDSQLHVAAWDYEDEGWEDILRYQEGTCQ